MTQLQSPSLKRTQIQRCLSVCVRGKIKPEDPAARIRNLQGTTSTNFVLRTALGFAWKKNHKLFTPHFSRFSFPPSCRFFRRGHTDRCCRCSSHLPSSSHRFHHPRRSPLGQRSLDAGHVSTGPRHWHLARCVCSAVISKRLLCTRKQCEGPNKAVWMHGKWCASLYNCVNWWACSDDWFTS